MEETLEIWEFTVWHPSGQEWHYQLEDRHGELKLRSDDPEFETRRVKSKNAGQQMWLFIKTLASTGGEPIHRGTLEREVFPGNKSVTKVDSYIADARRLLGDNARFKNQSDGALGRVIQTLEREGFVRFAPRVFRTKARIQKTAALGPFSSVPPLNDNFVPRPEISEPLVAELCKPGSTSGVGLTGLGGMGGVGKTILAIALSHDKRVRENFADGIVWLRFGPDIEKDFGRRVKAICDHLGQRFEDYSTAALQTALSHKAVLIVLDDVWNYEDLKPFLVTSPRSRLLFTSRDKTIARAVGILGQEVGTLDPAQARSVLQHWSHRGDDLPEPHASDILAECGGLALALSMIGAALASQAAKDWQRVSRNLREAKLEYVGTPITEYEYTTLDAAVAVSVKALEAKVREKYLKLAVLLEGMPATPPILQALWGGNEDDLGVTTKCLVNRSLARFDGEGIILHSIQTKYLRSRWFDAASLDLIHGSILLAWNILETDPGQFLSQLYGRLMPYRSSSAIRDFLHGLIAAASAPWLRTLRHSLHMPGTPLIRTFQGHASPVRSVVLTQDERRAVSASDDEIKMWDLATGRELSCIDISEYRQSERDAPVYRTIQQKDGTIELVVSAKVATVPLSRILLGSQGMNEIVIAQFKNSIHAWNLTTNQKLWSLQGISGLAIAQGQHRLLTVSEDGTLNLWNVNDGSTLRTLRGHKRRFTGDAILCDETCAVSITDRNALTVLNLESGRVVKTVSETVLNDCSSIDKGFRSASPTFYRLGGFRRVLIAWDNEDGERMWSFSRGPVRSIGGALGVAKKKPLAVSGWGSVLKVWDVETGNTLRSMRSHSGTVSDIAVTNDGTRAVSVSYDATLKLWDLDSDTDKRIRGHHSDAVTSISVSADGTKAMSTAQDGTLHLWDLRRLRKLRTLSWNDSFRFGCIAPNGKRAISVLSNRNIIVWDLDAGEAIKTFCDEWEMRDLTVTPDSQSCIAAYKGEVVVWNYETGEVIRKINDCYPESLFLLNDGRRILFSSNNTLMEWDFTKDSAPRIVIPYLGEFCKVSRNGRWAASMFEGVCVLWDLRTSRKVRHFSTSELDRLAFVGDDGQRMGIIHGQTIHVWDVATRSILASFTSDAPLTRCVFIGPALVIVGDRAGHVHFLALDDIPTPNADR